MGSDPGPEQREYNEDGHKNEADGGEQVAPCGLFQGPGESGSGGGHELLTNSWIGDGVQQIRQKIYRNISETDGQDAAFDQIVITI